MTGIYIIRNVQTGDYYGGGTENSLARRFRVHKNLLNKGKHFNERLQRAWNKYGEDAFVFEILQEADKSKVRLLEQNWIDEHIDDPKCYNMSRSADHPSQRQLSEAHKEKIRQGVIKAYDANTTEGKQRRQERSDRQKKRIAEGVFTEEYRAKIGDASRNNKERAAKISRTIKGKKKSKKHRAALKEAWKRRKLDK
jgi:group I intron endonuclease